ncbi:MAG: electron transfer flavoprotein subunit alpha [Desulfobacteraceae bacterium 4572_130]|nr:MAG: electron transfer flavoprotein subunit alpha [Desulfobacteraceae bacterium 4572_130]
MSIWIIEKQCDGCKLCTQVCPYEGIEITDGIAKVTERCTSCGACIDICKNKAIDSDITQREIPDFSAYTGIWVFIEHNNIELTGVSLELLGKAQELAKDLNEQVSAVLIGKDVTKFCNTLTKFGAQNIYFAEHDLLEQYRTIAYTNVIESLVKKYKPSILLIGATTLGRDLAPRVSRHVKTGLTADCTDLKIDSDERILLQTRPAFGGNVMATIVNKYSRPQMATIRPGVMEKIKQNFFTNSNIIKFKPELHEKNILTRVLEIIKEKKSGIDITKANVIVAGGRGINGRQGFDMLKQLADLLGGELACTRLVVEQGILPQQAQVGQTGKTVRPEIYIACGISGAIQHRAGMMGSRYIIAINNDPDAPIFKVANWSIIGDVNEIVPEMIKQLSKGGTP